MRTVVIGSDVFFVPEGWTIWTSQHLVFERRPDESIWCAGLGGGTWRCVSPCLLPSRRPA